MSSSSRLRMRGAHQRSKFFRLDTSLTPRRQAQHDSGNAETAFAKAVASLGLCLAFLAAKSMQHGAIQPDTPCNIVGEFNGLWGLASDVQATEESKRCNSHPTQHATREPITVSRGFASAFCNGGFGR